MKKLIKNLKLLTVVLMCSLLTLPAFAASVTLSIGAASAGTNLVVGAGQITSLVFSGAGAAAVKVQLFDGITNSTTYVIGAYTNYTPTVVSVTNVYSTLLDSTVTNIYTVITNVPATIAQSTNTLRSLGAFSIPTNETVTITYDTANPFFRGITATNNGALTITVNYLNWR